VPSEKATLFSRNVGDAGVELVIIFKDRIPSQSHPEIINVVEASSICPSPKGGNAGGGRSRGFAEMLTPFDS